MDLSFLTPLYERPGAWASGIDRKGADFELHTTLGSRPAGQVHGEDWPVTSASVAPYMTRFRGGFGR